MQPHFLIYNPVRGAEHLGVDYLTWKTLYRDTLCIFYINRGGLLFLNTALLYSSSQTNQRQKTEARKPEILFLLQEVQSFRSELTEHFTSAFKFPDQMIPTALRGILNFLNATTSFYV